MSQGDEVASAATDVEANPGVQATWTRYLATLSRDLRELQRHRSDEFPHFSEGGRWTWLSIDTVSSWGPDGVYEHGNWTAGFTLGSLALLERAAPGTVDPKLFESRAQAIASRSGDTTTHDLGFLFFPGHVFGPACGVIAPGASDHALQAAETLVRRFNEPGAYLQAFGAIGDTRSAGTSTIDTMMNLPLLWWAGAKTGEPRFNDVARGHARTSARLFLRPDGTTFHALSFDSVSGEVRRRGTFQGASDDSCWSRGQAWAISGFAWAWAASGEPEFLEAAEATAEAFWQRLPADGIPPWDFSDRAVGTARDASAGAIAALGSLILGQGHSDRLRREMHRQRGERLLINLGSCLSGSDEGVLQESCYSLPAGLGVKGAVAWGDFYFGLALALAAGAIDLSGLLALPVRRSESSSERNGGIR